MHSSVASEFSRTKVPKGVMCQSTTCGFVPLLLVWPRLLLSFMESAAKHGGQPRGGIWGLLLVALQTETKAGREKSAAASQFFSITWKIQTDIPRG